MTRQPSTRTAAPRTAAEPQTLAEKLAKGAAMAMDTGMSEGMREPYFWIGFLGDLAKAEAAAGSGIIECPRCHGLYRAGGPHEHIGSRDMPDPERTPEHLAASEPAGNGSLDIDAITQAMWDEAADEIAGSGSLDVEGDD